MDTTSTSPRNRRQSFRLRLPAQLSVYSAAAWTKQVTVVSPDQELARLDQQLQQAMQRLGSRWNNTDHELHHALDAMQQQIKLLQRTQSSDPSERTRVQQETHQEPSAVEGQQPPPSISVSVDGVAFTSDSRKEIGEDIYLCIRLAGLAPVITTAAQVTRIARTSGADRAGVLVAATFDHLDSWQERRLQRFLHDQQRLRIERTAAPSDQATA